MVRGIQRTASFRDDTDGVAARGAAVTAERARLLAR